MRKILWIALVGLLVPAVGWAQGLCRDATITATGRKALNMPSGVYSYPSASFTYRTTGSPTGVSIAIEASNYPAATETPITMISAVTTTSGNVSMGNTARPFRNWFANTATLSGGTSPTIVLTACWNYSAFTIAEFLTAPTFSSMTAGSVLFAGTGGVLSQNNANFFRDDTTNRFLVGPRIGFDTNYSQYYIPLARNVK